MPTANPDNPACTLLTKKDRSDLVGYSMDDEVAVRPERGSAECMWVHSVREPARAVIRVIALSGKVWALHLRPLLRAAMLRPTAGKALKKKLEKVWKDLDESGGRLPADEVCPTYLMLAEARGAVRNGDTVYYATIGSMPAAYAMSCNDGNMIVAAYGEHGIGPSIALQNGVLRLVAVAQERADDVFEQVEAEIPGTDDADGTGAASRAPESPSPEPSPAEADSEDADES